MTLWRRLCTWLCDVTDHDWRCLVEHESGRRVWWCGRCGAGRETRAYGSPRDMPRRTA